MEISEKIIDQLAGEVLKEIEEEAKAAGRKITFDDLEKSTLRIRQKLGEHIIQKAADTLNTGKLEKKTVRNADAISRTKGAKKRK